MSVFENADEIDAMYREAVGRAVNDLNGQLSANQVDGITEALAPWLRIRDGVVRVVHPSTGELCTTYDMSGENRVLPLTVTEFVRLVANGHHGAELQRLVRWQLAPV